MLQVSASQPAMPALQHAARILTSPSKMQPYFADVICVLRNLLYHCNRSELVKYNNTAEH